MVGLHYLKHLYNVSDEVVVASGMENPYWQYFCGAEDFAHALPCDPTSLVKWRQRVRAEGREQLLKESLAAAQREAVRQLKRARRETRKLRTYLGRVLRKVERGSQSLSEKQAAMVALARRIFEQQRDRSRQDL